MVRSGYDLLAEEYYDNSHKTCRNFDATTMAAFTAGPVTLPDVGLILEVGCGRGRCGEFLGAASERVVQLDSSRDMLALAQREPCKLKLHTDACSIPVFDGEFVVVVGFLIDPFIGLNFFAEAFRVLSSGGMLVVTTPSMEWGTALRGDEEKSASTARFLTKNKETVEVPSTLISVDRLRQMLAHVGFQDVTIGAHCLPSGTKPISPDIQAAADKRNVTVGKLPILYLIQAKKP